MCVCVRAHATSVIFEIMTLNHNVSCFLCVCKTEKNNDCATSLTLRLIVMHHNKTRHLLPCAHGYANYSGGPLHRNLK